MISKKAVLFDMDGVLIDSEPFYMREFVRFMKTQGIEVTEQDLKKIPGSSDEFEILSSFFPNEISSDELYERFLNQFVMEPIAFDEIINPYVKTILKKLQNQEIKIALVSSSSMKSIQRMLKENDLENYFDVIVSGEQFQQSKPNPEIYEYTLKQLDVRAEDAIVVEDSTYGIEAAKAAGIEVIAKFDNRYNFDQSNANWIVFDLFEAYKIIEKGGVL